MSAAHPPPADVVIPADDDDIDFEEWDGTSPFWVHCVAGSVAGVVEHTAVYPLDTVRTHIQVCATCVRRLQTHQALLAAVAAKDSNKLLRHNGASAASAAGKTLNPMPNMGMWQTFRYLMNESSVAINQADTAATAASSNSSRNVQWTLSDTLRGWRRLWRGVQTILIGCVPAHALYFSSYEIVKAATVDQNNKATTYGSSLAGAAAVTSHDLILTPLDTIKQRLQLGHYGGVMQTAIRHMYAEGGYRVFYRSLPVTLATNVPYGMIMVSTHEATKQVLRDHTTWPAWQAVLLSSSLGGFTAAAVTTPLDRIKTALQTQAMAPACWNKTVWGEQMRSCPRVTHDSWHAAARYIGQHEGWQGWWRGVTPRVLSHTPAVAISWTTYETAKAALLPAHV